jgi:1-acyl-sn-glycerol-3-phosphate acyltransferase
MSEAQPNQGGEYFPIPDIERYHRVRNNLGKIMSKFGMVVIGGEYVDELARSDSGNGVIIASTHESWIDIVALGAANDLRPMRFLGKEDVWRYPFIGKLAVDAGAYSVDRLHHDSRQAAVETTVKMVNNGEWVTMYIEGTRNRSKDKRILGKTKTGVARAAIQAQGVTPVLPVAISYRESLIFRKSSLRKPVVVFGEPLFVNQSQASSDEVNELTSLIGKNLLELKNHAMDIVENKEYLNWKN